LRCQNTGEFRRIKLRLKDQPQFFTWLVVRTIKSKSRSGLAGAGFFPKGLSLNGT